MKKKINITFFILMMAMLIIPVMMTNTEDGAVSDVDGRVFTAKPVFGEEGYQQGMEKWINDRLGFRDEIAIAHAELNDRLFGELISTTYQYGSDKQAFFKMHDNIKYGVFHVQFADMVADMQRYCESRGTKFYYVFNPEKESIYRDYLPAGVNYDDEWADSMLSYMKSRGINVIDLRDTLREIDKKEPVFGRQYDAGHWNHTGDFYGVQALTERIHEDIPGVKILDKAEYDITTANAEKMFGSNQVINEEVPSYTLKAVYEDVTGDMASELRINADHPYFRLISNKSENAGGIERMLLFGDCVFDPFAFARAKETASISCLQNVIDIDYYYNVFNPDVVVFESMERVVNDQNFSRDLMQAAERNPAIIENFPEGNFSERRYELLEDTEELEFESKPEAILIPGSSVDRVYLSSGMMSAKYTYIITDSRAIDLKRNVLGAMETSVRHGELKPGTDVVLYRVGSDGSRNYAVIPVTADMENVATYKTCTANVKHQEKGNIYRMDTDISGNLFGYTVLQIYDANIKEYCKDIVASAAVGTVDGAYCHTLPTGDYTLILKAGGNLAEEWIAFSVRLEKGQSYWFAYNVDEMSEKQVLFSGFSFSKLKLF